MSEIHVVQLRNPDGLQIEEVRELIERGISANAYAKSQEGAFDRIAEATTRDDAAVFLVRTDARWAGYLVLEWNPSKVAFEEQAWVVYIYSDGSPGVVREMMRSGREWMQERGIEKIAWVNVSGRSDGDAMALSENEFNHRVVGSVIHSTPKE